ncbi:MAG: UDP-glucuronic acid decarboxylase family protein [Hydrogenophilales bacterium]
MKKKVLVTGGTGFLGSHICKRLIQQDINLVCIDNLSSSDESNIESLKGHNNFTFIKHDVVDPIDDKFDEIYNFACPASPPQYQKDPIQTSKTSVYGAFNLLENAKKNNSKIFQASTSEVYGDPTVSPQNENYFGNVNPIGIRSCYDEGKRFAETLFFDYFRKFSTNIKVVRIFNTYGPNMQVSDGRVISNIITQSLKNIDITVYGDGKQTRSFCYVDDLIDIILLIMKSKHGLTGPFNIGNPSEFTIIDIAKKIIHLTNSKSTIKYLDLPQDDPKQRKPDISLVKEIFNWNPKIETEEGLKKTINYFRAKL